MAEVNAPQAREFEEDFERIAGAVPYSESREWRLLFWESRKPSLILGAQHILLTMLQYHNVHGCTVFV